MRATAGKRKAKVIEAAANDEAPPDGFREAVRQAAVNPGDESAWQTLEEAAAGEEDAARLLRHYRSQLVPETPAAVRDTIGRRAFRFAADCYGENAAEVGDLLQQLLAVAPDTSWAFAPLAAALTTSASWTELLALHDARLAANPDPSRRRSLLAEAAHIAKDLAGDQSRAADYLTELSLLDPGDVETAAALERLLERQERWADLVELWRRRAAALPAPQARELRRKIALAAYEKLADPLAALTDARQALPADGKDAQLLDLLGRLLRDERLATEGRLGALDLLRAELDASGQRARMPELLSVALGFAQGEALRDLRRESAERLQALGDDAGAFAQYAAVLRASPEDREAEHRLRQLSEPGGQPRRAGPGAPGGGRGLRAGRSARGAAGHRGRDPRPPAW